MLKKSLTLITLFLAVAVGGALSPALLSLPVAAQDGEFASQDIAAYIAADLAPLHTIDVGGGAVTATAFSPDSQLLATASSNGDVRVWQAADGSLLFTLSGHTAAVSSLAFSPDGEKLASGAADNTVRVWICKMAAWMMIIEPPLPAGC